jgi:hypothetical protein
MPTLHHLVAHPARLHHLLRVGVPHRPVHTGVIGHLRHCVCSSGNDYYTGNAGLQWPWRHDRSSSLTAPLLPEYTATPVSHMTRIIRSMMALQA